MPLNWIFQGGRRKTLTISATAGNVTTNLSPGAGKRWLVLRGTITLVTDATVGSRYLTLNVTNGTNITEWIAVSSAQSESSTKIHSFGEARGGNVDSLLGHRGLASSPEMYVPIEPILLENDDQLRIYVTGGVAGDSYSGYVVVLEAEV